MLGLLGAVLAALAYGTATILQAIGVRQLDALPEHPGWPARLKAGRLYAVGLALDGLGFLLSFAALRTLPLFLVESMLASSVAVTAVLAVVVLHVRLRRAEVAALGVVGIGLVLLALSAHEGPGRAVGSTGGWLLLGFAVIVGVLFALGYADRDRSRSSVQLAVVSGLGFGVTGIAARVIEPAKPLWHTIIQPQLWALIIGGIAAVVAYGFALDRGKTTTVAAITFAVETIVPAAIGLAFLGDAIRHGLVVVAVLGFAATLGGCLALAGRAEVD
ncbi:hypothetical protein G9U51_11275 [Calidifontibacter sp. DB0510]|uniref:DMT family transporter n=1 Tax=Metallococcus carri TaxID=1656884 RepID=A0A967EHH3_9MICO|nr:hypothetical protein [Metallococcus carri]NHN56358.1 hypothetical protein [Metallococcus carri]NOP35982.1 hypothetical protein [Calidifontibacter sp. DB2511S]